MPDRADTDTRFPVDRVECTAALRRLYADICTGVHVHAVLVRVICSFVNLWLRKREFRVASKGEESRFAERISDKMSDRRHSDAHPPHSYEEYFLCRRRAIYITFR